MLLYYNLQNIYIQKDLGKMGSNSSSAQQLTIQKLKKQLQQKNKRLEKLKTQNKVLIKQTLSTKSTTKDYSVDDLLGSNYKSFICMSCQTSFDQQYYIPIMICKKQHTICQPCCQAKQKKRVASCPQCGNKFQNMGKNRSILQLITNKQQLLKYVKKRDAQMQQQAKNALMQSQLAEKFQVHFCKFQGRQSLFEIKVDSLLKLSQQNNWHTIRTIQALPTQTQSQVSLKVINSSCNSIIVGVTSQTQQFQKGYIPSFSVAYHLNNGHIYDQSTQNTFKWRAGGTPVPKKSNPRVLMTINTVTQRIKWKINNKIHGQAQISDTLIKKPLYVFIAVFHKDDMLVLNK